MSGVDPSAERGSGFVNCCVLERSADVEIEMAVELKDQRAASVGGQQGGHLGVIEPSWQAGLVPRGAEEGGGGHSGMLAVRLRGETQAGTHVECGKAVETGNEPAAGGSLRSKVEVPGAPNGRNDGVVVGGLAVESSVEGGDPVCEVLVIEERCRGKVRARARFGAEQAMDLVGGLDDIGRNAEHSQVLG
jgi:hypothetical protein